MQKTSFLALSLFLLPLLGALVEPSSSDPVPEQEAVPATSAEEEHPFSWLVGHWIGEGLGGVAEEWWSAPAGGTMDEGTMMGAFRLVAGGETRFYELFTLEERDGEWGMRMRHFHADLSAWEEKDEPLVWEATVLEEGRAGFGPVLYERVSDDEVRVSVETGNGGTAEFVYHRAD